MSKIFAGSRTPPEVDAALVRGRKALAGVRESFSEGSQKITATTQTPREVEEAVARGKRVSAQVRATFRRAGGGLAGENETPIDRDAINDPFGITPGDGGGGIKHPVAPRG